MTTLGGVSDLLYKIGLLLTLCGIDSDYGDISRCRKNYVPALALFYDTVITDIRRVLSTPRRSAGQPPI